MDLEVSILETYSFIMGKLFVCSVVTSRDCERGVCRLAGALSVWVNVSGLPFFLKKEPDALPEETTVQNLMIYHQGSQEP